MAEDNSKHVTYITGFIYDASDRFLLIRKNKGPSTVIGKLTGIGGKVEEQDFFHTDAMDREIREELGEDFKFDWTTLGMVEYEGYFINVIFYAKVENIYNLDGKTVPSKNDIGEKFEIHHANDIICHEECGLGVKSIVALLVWENPETDRIEVTRYKKDG